MGSRDGACTVEVAVAVGERHSKYVHMVQRTQIAIDSYLLKSLSITQALAGSKLYTTVLTLKSVTSQIDQVQPNLTA